LQPYVARLDYTVALAGDLSLARYSGDGTPVFFSPTSGYIVDPETGMLIKFNPTAMEITGDAQVREDRRAKRGVPSYPLLHLQVDGQLYPQQ
jgi:hypothetical protein